MTISLNRFHEKGGDDIPVADGGTGASTDTNARTNLGVPETLSDVLANGANTGTNNITIASGQRIEGAAELSLRAGAGSAVSLQNNAGTSIVEADSTGLGFFAVTPVAQPVDTGALTDSTGGSVDGTLAAISGSGADADINNNFADIADRINDIRDALRNLGLMA